MPADHDASHLGEAPLSFLPIVVDHRNPCIYLSRVPLLGCDLVPEPFVFQRGLRAEDISRAPLRKKCKYAQPEMISLRWPMLTEFHAEVSRHQCNQTGALFTKRNNHRGQLFSYGSQERKAPQHVLDTAFVEEYPQRE
jgi:hypothetical protein